MRGESYMQDDGIIKNSKRDEEVNVMPTIEMIEYEKVAYVKEMEDYLDNLKNMQESEAKKKSFYNLVQSEIICENGEFTERYRQRKITLKRKR